MASPSLHKRLPLILTTLLILAYYSVFLVHPLSLVSADLGRHIKNGEILFRDLHVLSSNYYSYTFPEFPVVNHHWLSGIVFFLLTKAFGIVGPQVLFLALSFAALALMCLVSVRRSSLGITALVACVTVPILWDRTEVRPEAWSYFFSALFFWLLLEFEQKRVSARALVGLPLLQLLWVNFHIYFFLGPFLVAVFWLDAVAIRKKAYSQRARKALLRAFLATSLACLVNPFGVKGVLYPFFIFRNFGYRLAENQSVGFMQKILPNPIYGFFWIVLGMSVLSFAANLRKELRRENAVALFLIGVFSVLGYSATRNLALFALFALPLPSWLIFSALPPVLAKKTRSPRFLAISGGASFVFSAVLIAAGTHFYSLGGWGIGTFPGDDSAARFVREQQLHGPIFNNYDIGGYLIYHLFPEYRVFVDNRPEAYPSGFFERTYVPMQEKEQLWKEAESRYGFNTIVFGYRDLSPWGQNFIQNRVQDPLWVPVFADQRIVILVKDNPLNHDIITRFALPRAIFRSKSSAQPGQG